MSQATPASSSYTNSNLFSGYYLDERVDSIDAWNCDEEARAVFRELQALWDAERDLVRSYNENELLGSWIDPVLAHLGYDWLSETTLPDGGGYNDRLLFDSAGKRREAAVEKRDGRGEEAYGLASALLEAKQWDADFTARFAEERSYRDASHQVKYYLERTPDDLGWGILTNGRTWRLYGTKDYETSTYYEVDLVHLLESGDLERFKYFYVFFRPAAFRGQSGETFLDRVWAESESAAQQLGEDLQDNVFTALGVLGTGFAETNALDIEPGDAARLDELKEQSLVLLYRLMFVLYAESRDLIDPDDAHSTEYDENFSLDRLRREIVSEVGEAATERAFDREYSTYATGMWSRLDDLFALIDEGNASLGIPPYNGGLFDEDSHEFLVENEVADRYLAEVIYRLSTTETPEGFVPAEYADLDTRHLGSIYEGLLEHEFRIAPEELAAVSAGGEQVWKPATEVSVADAVETVEKGELYVVNDDGERKATGAYYTPDYVVTYIVEETLGPLVEGIDADLRGEGLDSSEREYFRRFWARVTDLKVLDPAMGSGHFLTRATGYLTEQVMSVVREQEIGSYGEDDLRRRIAKECIYGVDLNGMAVELAKLSMWLETLAADQPLAFLDHHLKTGNSLVGSDITEVLSDGDEREDGQLTFAQVFARTRKRALEHVMELMADLLAIDNETLADVKSMEEIYDEIRADPLYRRLFEMADVHTAERFGVDVPADAYERMARAIEDDEQWAEIEGIGWFREAREVADEESFFHWELEFPEVFFDGEGTKREAAGFDAVVGNPPYVRIQRIHQELARYLFAKYESCSSRTDLSVPFIEAAISRINESGNAAYVSTSQWISTDYGRDARKAFSGGKIQKIVNFNTLPVFRNVSTYPAIFVMAGSPKEVLHYAEITEESDLNIDSLKTLTFRDIEYNQFGDGAWVFDDIDLRSLLRKRVSTTPLSEFGHFHIGAITGADEAFVVTESDIQNDNLEQDLIYPYAHRNEEIDRYGTVEPNDLLIYPYQPESGNSKLIPEPRLKEEYPNIHSHLKGYEQELMERKDTRRYYAKGPDWFQLLRPGNFEYIRAEKLLFRGLAKRSQVGWLQEDTIFSGNNCPGFISNSEKYSDEYLLALLNSTLLSEYLVQISPAKMQNYSRFNAGDLNQTPIRTIDFAESVESPELTRVQRTHDAIEEEREKTTKRVLSTLSEASEPTIHDSITYLVENISSAVDSRESLNLSLLDHLGNYDADGPTLTEIGFTQPPAGAADSILHETAETRANLRVGSVEIDREGETTVTIHLSARYKPDDEGDHDLDRWGYTETDPVAALRITDLTTTEADLIGAFVPVAVKEAGGFAGFRETATKTNSLVDRLEKLTLPVVSNVESGLNRYIDTRERADELDERIERTDRLIDEIVYELYGLTDEEIEIVESAVGGD